MAALTDGRPTRDSIARCTGQVGTQTPTERKAIAHAMDYDAARQRVVLFGNGGGTIVNTTVAEGICT